MEKMNVGIIGCGVISNTYIRDIQRLYKNLRLSACGDVNIEAARGQAEKYGIPVGCSPEELLEMEEIQIVINLTPPGFHTEINRKILEAGKHVFCEKPFALNLQEACEIRQLAREKKLWACSAPDTFMGSGLQTCRKLLEDGWIGEPLYVVMNMMSHGVETWHPAPENFYKEGAGPLYDMGPYYFTALGALLGPVKEIFGYSAAGYPKRQIYTGPRKGEEISVEIPTHYSGVAKMTSGILVSINMSFDIWKSGLPMFEIYGTEGTLEVPDPNMTGGRPKVYRRERILERLYREPREEQIQEEDSIAFPEIYLNVGEYTRGAGVQDLANAIRKGEQPRTEAGLACHVIEAITGMMEASRTGRVYHMKTSCTSPRALDMGIGPEEI